MLDVGWWALLPQDVFVLIQYPATNMGNLPSQLQPTRLLSSLVPLTTTALSDQESMWLCVMVVNHIFSEGST